MGLMTNYSSLDTTGGSRRTDSLSGGRRSMRARRAKSILINWRYADEPVHQHTYALDSYYRSMPSTQLSPHDAL